MLSSFVAQSLKSYDNFSDPGVEIALSHRHVEKRLFSRVKQIHESTTHTFTVWARPRLNTGMLYCVSIIFLRDTLCALKRGAVHVP